MKKLIPLIIILLIALLFRVFNLDKVPAAFNGDEANLALDAISILDGNLFLIGPNEGTSGALWLYLLAAAFGVFGKGIVAARGLSAAVSLVGIVVAYRFSYSLLSPVLNRDRAIAVASIVGLYLAVARWYVELSRVAFSANLGVLVQLGFFAALWWALRTRQMVALVIAGLLLGLTGFTYIPLRFTPLVPLVFVLLDGLLRWHRGAFLRTSLKQLVSIAAIGGLMYTPLLITYFTGGLGDKARAFTVFNPVVSQGNVWGLLFRTILGNLAGYVPGIPQVAGTAVARGVDDLSLILFLIGLALALWRIRKPEYLFVVVWWGVMLLPSIIGPEGATPHLRRALGTAVPTFILIGIGVVIPLKALITRFPVTRVPAVVVGLLTVSFSLFTLAKITYVDYYLPRLTDPDFALLNHIYDFELADVMAAEGDAQTAYILPVDTAAGAIFPESSTLAFLYRERGEAEYAYIWDNQDALFADMADLLAGKRRVGVVDWQVSKHSAADPRHLFDYVLERMGTHIGGERHQYFNLDYYQLDETSKAVQPARLTSTAILFGDVFTLNGIAFAGETPVDEPLWAELGWQKTAAGDSDYQVALWLEDEAGHIVGRVDRPLLSDWLHQSTGAWDVQTEERDYYLIPLSPGTPPGDYRLKAVLYRLDDAGQAHRERPQLPDVGADLAAPLATVHLAPPSAPVDVATLDFKTPLNRQLVPGLTLLAVETPWPETFRPGDRGTLGVWWQSNGPLPEQLKAAVTLLAGNKTISLSASQPLGSVVYPTGLWPVGTVIRNNFDFRLPADLPDGTYTLQLALSPGDAVHAVQDIAVAGRPRQFEVPPVELPLNANFAGKITLLGVDQAPSETALDLTLYWQAQSEMAISYKIFIHLLDSDGTIVAQADRLPLNGDAPTTTWLPGEVIVDPALIDLPQTAQIEQVVVGLYNPADGSRLPLIDSGLDLLVLDGLVLK